MAVFQRINAIRRCPQPTAGGVVDPTIDRESALLAYFKNSSHTINKILSPKPLLSIISILRPYPTVFTSSPVALRYVSIAICSCSIPHFVAWFPWRYLIRKADRQREREREREFRIFSSNNRLAEEALCLYIDDAALLKTSKYQMEPWSVAES